VGSIYNDENLTLFKTNWALFMNTSAKAKNKSVTISFRVDNETARAIDKVVEQLTTQLSSPGVIVRRSDAARYLLIRALEQQGTRTD